MKIIIDAMAATTQPKAIVEGVGGPHPNRAEIVLVGQENARFVTVWQACCRRV